MRDKLWTYMWAQPWKIASKQLIFNLEMLFLLMRDELWTYVWAEPWKIASKVANI